jgi:hypothetical protein
VPGGVRVIFCVFIRPSDGCVERLTRLTIDRFDDRQI